MSLQNPYEGRGPNADGRRRQPAGGRQPGGAGAPTGGMSPEEFAQMCHTIEESVSQVAKLVGVGLGKAGSAAVQAADACQQAYREAAQTNARPAQPDLARVLRERAGSALASARFRSTAGLTASGVVMAAFGGMLTVSFLVALVIALVVPLAGAGVAVAGLSAAFAALSGWLLAAGVGRLRLASRAKAFQRVFGSREVCDVSELARQLGMSDARALAAARQMLKRGLLPQGHLDDEGTCLMVTDDAYLLYRQVQQARAQQLAEERAARERSRLEAEAARARGELPAEARAFVSQGGGFLGQMRELDARIDDAAVSAKIAALAEVVERILARVADEPSAAGGLERLNSYYLPTTVKLLEAYDDLEDQPSQLGNVASSRQEIERALDTLHGAFEKLLDETFQDLTLDVSSDVSVLHAVLAQEGLTEGPFGKR
ncbi:5-bromo-4-chloroindolyl phosphate hydrolysis family protein [Adlercreutzia sp. ZJ176]|uniref:5-bromo-4-chloroindolyl phosphate hydrolysis family protein n=2 Tax=unclassified Adlercreutzia TaxID=2636013 RepID=UPI0013EAA1FA|nr:5-bromo-4-chloroindolyl phosphate hydrolysis family protein [Adlercreutzia sp. ZJ176]